MSNIEDLRPESIQGIKRLAARFKSRLQLPHNEALDLAARRSGFKNYTHAHRAIECNDVGSLAAAEQRRDIDRRRDEFRKRTSKDWSETIEKVIGTATSTIWTGANEIIAAVSPFMGEGRNHGFYPTGGGNDFSEVHPSTESNCIELMVGSRAYIARPRRLRIERIATALQESFLFLELAPLPPSGVYQSVGDDDDSHVNRRLRESEELVDLGDGHYLERDVWSRGYMDHEDDPLPDNARLITRLLRGNIMFACKASIWNDIPETYQGWHDIMGADEVRRRIEQAVNRPNHSL